MSPKYLTALFLVINIITISSATSFLQSSNAILSELKKVRNIIKKKPTKN